MKRHEHTFQFSGSDVSLAAYDQSAYHYERMVWWKDQQEIAIKKAKEMGVEVREYEHTGGKSINVVVDTEVTSRLTTCANKIISHRAAADKFKIEAATYGTQPTRMYELQPDDVVYFRLCGGEREA